MDRSCYRLFCIDLGCIVIFHLLQEVQRAKAQEGVPDEEGWVTVTRHGKKPATPFTEAHKKHLTTKEKKKRKEKV